MPIYRAILSPHIVLLNYQLLPYNSNSSVFLSLFCMIAEAAVNRLNAKCAKSFHFPVQTALPVVTPAPTSPIHVLPHFSLAISTLWWIRKSHCHTCVNTYVIFFISVNFSSKYQHRTIMWRSPVSSLNHIYKVNTSCDEHPDKETECSSSSSFLLVTNLPLNASHDPDFYMYRLFCLFLSPRLMASAEVRGQ